MANQNTIVGNIGGNIRHKKIILWSYSSPRLVVDWMEELIVGILLVENVFSWGEKHCPPPNYWVIGPQHRFRCKTTMLSSKSPDHHVRSGVSGPPAVAVHGVAPAAAAEVIFKGLSFNNVGPIVGAVQGVFYSSLLVEKHPFVL